MSEEYTFTNLAAKGSAKILGLLLKTAQAAIKKIKITPRTCPFSFKLIRAIRRIFKAFIIRVFRALKARGIFFSPCVVQSWVRILYLAQGKINV